MYKKAWCTCSLVVLLIKPIAFLTLSLPSPSCFRRVPIDASSTVHINTFKKRWNWTLWRKLNSVHLLQTHVPAIFSVIVFMLMRFRHSLLVKRIFSYKVRMTVYNKHLESLPDTSSQIFDWKQFVRHSLSLSLSVGEQDSVDKQARRVNQRLTYHQQNDGKMDDERNSLTIVGLARKVSPNWSQETMTCHSSNCFSIVWGQGNAP